MNILITQSGKKFIKGYRYELFEKMRNNGHKLYHLDQDIKETYIDDDGDVHIPLVKFSDRRNRNPINEIVFIKELRKIFLQNNIECIVVYGIKIIPSMIIAAKFAKIDKRICVINGAGSLFMGDDLKIRIFRAIAFPMLKIAFSLSNNILIQNEDDYKMLINKHFLSKEKGVRTNGSGVNLQKFKVEPLSDEENFLLITRVTRTKGLHEYIKAASIVKEKYPSATFHLVGPKDDLDLSVDWNLVKDAIDRKIIIYHGETKDVISFIKRCRVFVFPSFYREGVPRAVLEAMAMGRPIITTDSPGCRETVIDCKNGFLVKPKDYEMLAEKIMWMIKNKDIVYNMGKESRKLAEDKFNIDDINDIVLKCINER